MSRVKYNLFAEVLVSHGYYRKSVFRDLIVTPDKRTKTSLQKADFIFKSSNKGFSLYYNETFGIASLKSQSKRYDGQLVFDLFSKNIWYTNFTEVPLDRLTFFEYSSKRVSATDPEVLNPEIKEDVNSSGKIASLVMDLSKFDQKTGDIPQSYSIRFAPRMCQWNYYILNATYLGEQTLTVRGPEGEPFDGPSTVWTAKGEQAWHYSSADRTYPILESPESYCTLSKYNELNGAYMPAERLPAAFPGAVTGFLNNDASQSGVAQSSIFIYL